MEPKYFDGKWHIEVDTGDSLGKVLLLKPGRLAIAIHFDTEAEAVEYIALKKGVK